MIRFVQSAVLGATLVLTLIGCAPDRMPLDVPIDIGDPAGPTLDQVVNRDNPPPRDRVMRLDLQPVLAAYTMTEDDVADPDKVKQVTVKIERVGDGPHPWRRHSPDERIEHLGVTADGGVVMVAVDDLDWGVTNWFDPPVPVMPADLKPGEPKTFTSTITVRGTGQPADAPPRDKGKLTLTLTLDADRLVQTPAGWFRCQHIVREQTIDLGMADVKLRSEQWYAPGHGMVASNASEHVHALIVGWTNNTRLRLIKRQPLQPEAR